MMKLVGKAAILVAAVATVATIPLSVSAAEFTTVTDIAYVDGGGASQVGNLYLPKKVTSSTPMVLTIHGGAWAGGDRASWRGVAEFFAGELGYAAFNIEYRLAGDGARWPACGDDCVAAARYILSSEFKSQYGLSYDKIWICGGSAGGHLALWTLVNLPTNNVAGCVAISPIGDPSIDYAKNSSRYSPLFGDTLNLDAMNPCLLVTSGMAPVLITHATDDKVVPIGSSKAFAAAYSAAGNQVDFFEYPCDLEPNEAGHCIWRPGSSPHRLINSLESKIAFFARTAAATSEWTARAMGVSAVNRTPLGTVSSVDLQFGEGNGLTNRLYLAYGETYGGDHMADWSRSQFICEVTDEMSTLHVDVPAARNYKFFLDVPFPGNQVGVPVRDVIGTGTQYIDTGVRLCGGDAIRARVMKITTDRGLIFGHRTAGASATNVVASFISKTFMIDYNNSDYNKYRLTTETSNEYTNRWIDILASAESRSVRYASSGALIAEKSSKCDDQFESMASCYLFSASGQPPFSDKFIGGVSAFSILRAGDYVASYVPYRFGETYGFFDRATGAFFTAVDGSGDFSGTEDSSMPTPLTSSTETIRIGKSVVEIPPRTISSCTLVKDGDVKYLDLVFGTDNGLSNKLYIAYGGRDRGAAPAAWESLEYLGIVSSETNTWRVVAPVQARHCRFFLSLPTEENLPPVALGSIVGNGTGYFDTGFTVKSDDAVQARVMPAQSRAGAIFGARGTDASDRNIAASFYGYIFIIDYNNSDFNGFRYVGDQALEFENRWFDVMASAEERSATDVATGIKIGSNTAICQDQFETPANCRLFHTFGGIGGVQTPFDGKIASFKMVRDGGLLTSLAPCRIGNQCGFYDTVNGRFLTPVEGTFEGVEDAAATPLFSVSDDVKVNVAGFVISFH